jgi:hypothetical protein
MILRYRNEVIVAIALLFALMGMGYKYVHRSSIEDEKRSIQHEIVQIHEAASLKERWADKRISKRLDALQRLFPKTKVTWKKSGKKLVASFASLSAEEVNRLITKLLNIAVRIEALKIKKQGKTYQVEMTCKW